MICRQPWLAAPLLAVLPLVSCPALAQGEAGGEAAAPTSPSDVEAGATEGAEEEGAVAAEPSMAAESESEAGTAADEDAGDLEAAAVPKPGTDAGSVVPDWRAAATPLQQREARRLFQEGNQLVKESLFVQAVEKYDEALGQWDHPGIHYNLALALLNLDQPVRFRAHLVESLKFGETALGKDKARRAKQYLSLVEKQLTELVIRCDHEKARVKLDGEFLFVAPGEERRFVRPGQHTIKATAAGFETTERSLSLVAGRRIEVPVRLYKPEDWIQTERRWKAWGPIAVTASGAAIAGLGATLYGIGSDQVRDFDAKVEDRCGDGGCAAGEIDESPERGENLQGVGLGTIVLGGATLVTGGVLLYLNRPIPHRVDPETADKLSVAPIVAPGAVGLVGRGVF